MEGLEQSIVIPLRGMKDGGRSHVFEIDGSFFRAFGNGRIHDADCSVRAELTRSGTLMRVRCFVGGYVVVECDRCLDDLTLKVDVDRTLTVGFDTLDSDDAQGSEEDAMVVDASDAELDISQFVYDYVCLSLPLIMVHPEGKCNPEMVGRLHSGTGETGEAEGGNSPFSGLKEMLEK